MFVYLGQSECKRTNRQPSRMCVAQCDHSTGCGGSGEECLCDGDCGYSCVKKGRQTFGAFPALYLDIYFDKRSAVHHRNTRGCNFVHSPMWIVDGTFYIMWEEKHK